MHEFSLCTALVEAAERQLAAHPGRRLRELRVSVGALSGCEPDLLLHLFPYASVDSEVEGAVLAIDFQPALVKCPQCGKTLETIPNLLRCPDCGSADVELVAGDGVFLTGLGFVEDETCAPTAAAG